MKNLSGCYILLRKCLVMLGWQKTCIIAIKIWSILWLPGYNIPANFLPAEYEVDAVAQEEDSQSSVKYLEKINFFTSTRITPGLPQAIIFLFLWLPVFQ